MAPMNAQLNILDLPDVVFENILLCLTYDEMAKARIVSQRFNEFCQRLLNRGFAQAVQFHAKCFKEVKSQLPRRESKRPNHPLARHNNILNAIETRLSLLKMTYCKYIHYNVCCFIPGKVIDELFRVLHLVNATRGHHIPHEILTELRDISSMAMDYFEEKIVPNLQKITSSQKRLAISPSTSQMPLLSDLSSPPQFVEPSGSQEGAGRSSLNAIISDAGGGGGSLFPFADDLLDREMRGAFMNLSPPDRLSELQAFGISCSGGGGNAGALQLVPVPAETLKSLVSALKESKGKKTKLERSVSLLQAKVVDVSRKLQDQERTIAEQSRLLSEHCVRFTHHNERINEIVNCSVRAEVMDLEATSASLLGLSDSDLEDGVECQNLCSCSTSPSRKRPWTQSAATKCPHSACSDQYGELCETNGRSNVGDVVETGCTLAKKIKRVDSANKGCSVTDSKQEPSSMNSKSCECSSASAGKKESMGGLSELPSLKAHVSCYLCAGSGRSQPQLEIEKSVPHLNEDKTTNSVTHNISPCTSRLTPDDSDVQVLKCASQKAKANVNKASMSSGSSLHPASQSGVDDCWSRPSLAFVKSTSDQSSEAIDQHAFIASDPSVHCTPQKSFNSPTTCSGECSVAKGPSVPEDVEASTVPSTSGRESIVDSPSMTRCSSTPRSKFSPSRNFRSLVGRARCRAGKSRTLLKRLRRKRAFAVGSSTLLRPTQLQLLKEIIRRERNLKRLHISLMSQTLGAFGSSPRLVTSPGGMSLVTHPPLLRTPEGRFILIQNSGADIRMTPSCLDASDARLQPFPQEKSLNLSAGGGEKPVTNIKSPIITIQNQTEEQSSLEECQTDGASSTSSHLHLSSPSLVKSAALLPRSSTPASDRSEFSHPYARSRQVWSSSPSNVPSNISNALPTLSNRDSTSSNCPSTLSSLTPSFQPSSSGHVAAGSAVCRYLASTVQASRAMANSCRQRRLRLGQKFARYKTQVNREAQLTDHFQVQVDQRDAMPLPEHIHRPQPAGYTQVQIDQEASSSVPEHVHRPGNSRAREVPLPLRRAEGPHSSEEPQASKVSSFDVLHSHEEQVNSKAIEDSCHVLVKDENPHNPMQIIRKS